MSSSTSSISIKQQYFPKMFICIMCKYILFKYKYIIVETYLIQLKVQIHFLTYIPITSKLNSITGTRRKTLYSIASTFPYINIKSQYILSIYKYIFLHRNRIRKFLFLIPVSVQVQNTNTVKYFNITPCWERANCYSLERVEHPLFAMSESQLGSLFLLFEHYSP